MVVYTVLELKPKTELSLIALLAPQKFSQELNLEPELSLIAALTLQECSQELKISLFGAVAPQKCFTAES